MDVIAWDEGMDVPVVSAPHTTPATYRRSLQTDPKFDELRVAPQCDRRSSHTGFRRRSG